MALALIMVLRMPVFWSPALSASRPSGVFSTLTRKKRVLLVSLYNAVFTVALLSGGITFACPIIFNTAGLERLQTTPESQQAMEDLSLSAEVKAALIDIKRDIQVFAQNGVVNVKATTLESKEFQLVQNINNIVEKIPGVKDVRINVISIPTYAHH